MRVGQRLAVRAQQNLTMTPQLQQAIKLLQLPHADLAALVAGEVERNPLLHFMGEAPRQPGAPPRGSAAPTGRRAPGKSGEGAAGSADAAAVADVGATSLHEHVRTQINTAKLEPAERAIALVLTDFLDDTGYLGAALDEIARAAKAPAEAVAKVLARVQRLDPPGVFARDLRECLALQLQEGGRLDALMTALLDHLPVVARRDIAALARLAGVDTEAVRAAIQALQALDPKPGLAFSSGTAPGVVPDILVRRDTRGGWEVVATAETQPQVRIDRDAYERLRQAARSARERAWLSGQLRAAGWLARALEQRATTLLRVAAAVVERQAGFLEHGVAAMKPLVMREIADALDLHESTISRVAANKWLETPRGTMALKAFFSPRLPAVAGAEGYAAAAVRRRIKTLIDAEAGAALSDRAIALMLREEGVAIARRTVTKYRESLDIPGSAQRRRGLGSAAARIQGGSRAGLP